MMRVAAPLALVGRYQATMKEVACRCEFLLRMEQSGGCSALRLIAGEGQLGA